MPWSGNRSGLFADGKLNWLAELSEEESDGRPASGWRLVPDTTDGVEAHLGGEATAIGNDTYADAELTLKARDLGKVSVVTGTASFSATAEGTSEADTLAAVDTFASVTGADIVVVSRTTISGSTATEDGYLTGEQEVVRLFAIDFEMFDFAGGPLVIERERSYEVAPDGSMLDGNLATFEVEVEAIADTSLADAEVSALTFEDQLSIVAALADVFIA